MSKTLRFASAAAAVTLVLPFAANAQYEKTKSTLAIPDRVEVPGAVLEPGTYLVRVTDVQANRNVVVFQSADGTKTYATAIATPHRGAKEPANSEFVFYPAAAGQPRVLRTWWARDDVNGQDFYYPAERLAALQNGSREESPVATDMVPASAPPPVAAPVAAAAPPPAPAPVETMASRDTSSDLNRGTDGDTLPQTASPYPTIGLLGLAALAGAWFLGRRRETA